MKSFPMEAPEVHSNIQDGVDWGGGEHKMQWRFSLCSQYFVLAMTHSSEEGAKDCTVGVLNRAAEEQASSLDFQMFLDA